ncbi:MAG: hypothetical protein KDC05_01950 [Bacteroidales bacterium]|nr:hypothetical protein [Bacteroidales bacterium]
MLKKWYGIILILLSFTMVFVSCTKEEEGTGPTLTFKSGTSGGDYIYLSQDTVLTVKHPFMLGIRAKTTSDKNLASIKIERKLEVVNVINILNKELSTPSFELDTLLKTNSDEGTEDFFCTVTDRNDMSTTIHFSVTTIPADPMITWYENINLGSYTSPVPQLFSTHSGETFNFDEVNDSTSLQDLIDWVYFHGSETYGHTLASPSAEIVDQIYPDDITQWESINRKTTKFKKITSMTGSHFFAIEDKEDLLVVIENQNINWENASHIFSQYYSTPGGFQTGNVIAFKTSAGRFGLIHIKSVTEGAINGESSIRLDIVIEDE